jgi:hypothetical protein
VYKDSVAIGLANVAEKKTLRRKKNREIGFDFAMFLFVTVM